MLVAYCTGLIVVCTALLVPATIFTIKNYWMLRELVRDQPAGKHEPPRTAAAARTAPVRRPASEPPRPTAPRPRAARVPRAEPTHAYYEADYTPPAPSGGDTMEWTGPVTPYTPANRDPK